MTKTNTVLKMSKEQLDAQENRERIRLANLQELNAGVQTTAIIQMVRDVALFNKKTAYFLLYGFVSSIIRAEANAEGLNIILDRGDCPSVKQLDYYKEQDKILSIFAKYEVTHDIITEWETIAHDLKDEENFTYPLSIDELKAYVMENAEDKILERKKEGMKLAQELRNNCFTRLSNRVIIKPDEAL